MGWSGDGTSVYPLIEEWRFTVTETGITGSRVYLEAKGQLQGVSSETLPDIGDSWDSSYKDVKVVSIDVSYFSRSCQAQGRKFVVNYDTRPSIQTAVVSKDDLPVAVDVGGEFITFEPYDIDSDGNKTNFSWFWSVDQKGVNVPVFRHQAIANIRFTKVVSNAEDFVNTSMDYVGKINSGTFFGFGPGLVLYEGCSMYQFKNKMGNNRWKAELHFAVRRCTGYIDNDGWNYLLRTDKGAPLRWDKPVDENGDGLYVEKDFDGLLSSNQLNDEEDYYNQFPER